MPKLQFSKGQYHITVPKEYVEQGKYVKGDMFTFSFNERGNMELRRTK